MARVAEQVIEAEHVQTGEEQELWFAFLAMVGLAKDDRWIRRVARSEGGAR